MVNTTLYDILIKKRFEMTKALILPYINSHLGVLQRLLTTCRITVENILLTVSPMQYIPNVIFILFMLRE